jgi:DNA-binding beta-propeller fold protein YncE
MTGGRGARPGIAVVKRSGGKLNLEHTVDLTLAPTGIVLTHDGKLLIAAAAQEALFIDTGKLMKGDTDAVVGSIGGGRGAIYANVTPDDKTLFVSQENGGSITVIDLERARREGFKDDAVIGQIPVGLAPIALTFSPDAKYLYTTSELAAPDWNWPKACKREGSPAPDTALVNPEGAVVVIDVARARTDPAHAVLTRVPAGCSAVRIAMSPSGDRIYVTTRNSNAVVAFDTSKLISDAAHAQVAKAPTGDAPVPVAVVDQGRKVIAGNSNRFAAGNAPQSLVVLSAANFDKGAGAVLGIIPAGAFPREMRVSADERTLFLTNFGSNSLQMLDISRLPIESKPQQ